MVRLSGLTQYKVTKMHSLLYNQMYNHKNKRTYLSHKFSLFIRLMPLKPFLYCTDCIQFPVFIFGEQKLYVTPYLITRHKNTES